MSSFENGDRVCVSNSFYPNGRKGVVLWVRNQKNEVAYGVKLDGDESGQTFFPHELTTPNDAS